MDRPSLLNLLDSYLQRWPQEAAVVERFTDLLNGYERCFHRDCWAGHVTGSAWLVNGEGTHVLLTHHKKLGRWLQLGGHSEGEPDTLLVAQREAEEESGLMVLALDHIPLDIDVHMIPARGQDPQHHHYDVRFPFRAVGNDSFTVSDESIDLAWVAIGELERYTDEESVLRMARKWLRRY